MDRLNEYRSVIQKVLNDYYQIYSQSESPNLETMVVNDRLHEQYMLTRLGWDDDRRINRTIIYLRLRDGKIWVEEDWTEQGVATDLLALGVPRDAIVLGFHPPHLREHTEFAVA